jgi:hypothetical protein
MSYRVRLNLKNYKPGRRTNENRLGTAPFIPREGQCWEVRWDGLKTVQSFHRDYIEVVKEDDALAPEA